MNKSRTGRPFHWSLFVAPEGEPGSVYQVKGDATFMRHVFAHNVGLLSSASYNNSYILTHLEDGEGATVRWYAKREEPPGAADRASVTENCQGWTIRVLRRLRAAGIVSEEWVNFAEGIKEPI